MNLFYNSAANSLDLVFIVNFNDMLRSSHNPSSKKVCHKLISEFLLTKNSSFIQLFIN